MSACGCKVSWKQTAESENAITAQAIIEYCPLHASAEKLREALEDMAKEPCSGGWMEAGQVGIKHGRCFSCLARHVLAAAQGQTK